MYLERQIHAKNHVFVSRGFCHAKPFQRTEHTGKTLAYGMRPFLETEVKSIEVAVLVNRSHTIFPIHPNYTGYELATTITEHVEVTLGKEASVYLK